MSKKLTLEEFMQRIPQEIKEAIEIMQFSGSSKPLVFKILNTGEIKEVSQARKMEKFSLKNVHKWGIRLPEHNIIDFQNKVDKLFGLDKLLILEYHGINLPCVVECLKCHDKRELATSEPIIKGKYPCHCYFVDDEKIKVQTDIDNLFGIEEYKLIKYSARSNKLLVRHKCGFIFEKATFWTLSTMRGCPKCFKAVSRGEQEISNILIKLGIPCTTQYNFNDLRGDTYPLRFDFGIEGNNGPLLIEFDGEGHYQTKECFGGDVGFEKTLLHDQQKNDYCTNNKIPLLRIPYWDFKYIKKLILEFLRLNDYPFGEYDSSESETLNS